MSVTEAVPGMKPGSTIRNVIIALIYLPLIFLWPFIAAYVVAKNRGGAAESLSGIPGVSKDGGIVAGVIAFVGMFVLLGVIGAVLPGGDTDTAGDGTDVESTNGGVDEGTTTESGSDGDATSDSDGSDGGTDSSSGDGSTDGSTGDGSDGSDSTSGSDESTTDDSPPPAPDGESYQFDGSGNDVSDQFTTAGGLVTINFEHTGESNFQVQAVGSGGEEEFLVNDIGNYDGTVALYLPEDDWRLDITADGDWSAKVEQPRFNESDLESLPAEGNGEHAMWFGPYEFDGSQEVTFEITNDAQAAVWVRDTNGQNVDLLHNEIGPYEGSALVTDTGRGLIVVETNAAEWRIEISE